MPDSTEKTKKRLSFLGPLGTFAEQAALIHDPEAELLPFASNQAVIVAVASGMADEGIVPIENSLEGPVTETVDLLIHESNLMIRHELVIPIEHCLLVSRDSSPNEIEAIFSHPQALGQCRKFIERCFPKAQQIASLSTTAAVQEMLSRPKSAAIATKRAADIYGAEIMAHGVQDNTSNVTRFVVLSDTDHEPTGRDKTSICFSIREDKPGALVEVLMEFSSRAINLAKIESRPSKETLGKYIFLIDLEGHRLDGKVAEALRQIEEKTTPEHFKIFGSYPQFVSAAD